MCILLQVYYSIAFEYFTLILYFVIYRQFLKGLKKYQRGQWKEISQEFVTTRTPSQIASHAQKYYDRQDLEQKERKKRRSIHDTTIDNNGRIVTLPIKKQNEIPIAQEIDEIPSIEQQNNTSSLVTQPIDEQNEIPSHGTTLNDSNNGDLVTPPIEPLQGMQQEHPQLECTIRTRDILPQDMNNVIKMCELLEQILKR
jgi:SHAQKYF class myb-like DNA-binding protein